MDLMQDGDAVGQQIQKLTQQDDESGHFSDGPKSVSKKKRDKKYEDKMRLITERQDDDDEDDHQEARRYAEAMLPDLTK